VADTRIRTHELLDHLELAVPASAIRVSDLAVCVGYRHDLVAFMRREPGWVAVVVHYGQDVDEREFTTVDEALEVLIDLWPNDEATAEAVLADTPDSPHARAVDAALASLQQVLAQRGFPEVVEFRPFKKSGLAERLHAQVCELFAKWDDEEGDDA
jgi:hypothetical protein